MDTSNKKILTVSFLSAGIIAGVVVHILMNAAMAVSGSATRAFSSDIVAHGVPFLIGVGTFLVMQLNPKILGWADEVVAEVRRAVWPSQRDTVAMTIAVIVMVVISAAFLGILDVLSSKVINLLVTWR